MKSQSTKWRSYSRVLIKISVVGALLSYRGAAAQSPTAKSHAAERPERVAAALNNGLALARNGHFVEAESALAQAHQLAPQDLDVLRTYGEVESRLGKSKQALDLLSSALQVAPRDPELLLADGLALADAGEKTQALSVLTLAQQRNGQSRAILFNRARLLEDLHRYPEAEQQFALLDHRFHGDSECLNFWASTEREMGNLEKEGTLLKRLSAAQPDNADVYVRLGRNLMERGSTEESIATLKRAVALNPSTAEPYYLLSRQLRATNPAEARAWTERYAHVREQEAQLDALRSLGNDAVHASLRSDWASAIQFNREALTKCEHCSIEAGLHRNLGLALAQSGDPKEGVQELRKAYSLNPNDPDTIKALDALGAEYSK